MQLISIPIWKQAPFVRIVISLMIGILLQWYFSLSIFVLFFVGAFFIVNYFSFNFLSLSLKYKFRSAQTIFLLCIVAFFGSLITFNKDLQNKQNWYGNIYKDGDELMLRIDEPVDSMAKNFRLKCSVKYVVQKNVHKPVVGSLIVYIEHNAQPLSMGDFIFINKSIRRIQNNGNPGSFNYKQYQAFQQIYHQLYFKKEEYIKLNYSDANYLNEFIFSFQQSVVKNFQLFISQDKQILGIAEALFIGYKKDLDQDIVQAYSNTGIVHIIAISGLHLGLLYIGINSLFNLIPLFKKSNWLKAISIIIFLWMFSFITGASASVLRSAVMFTCVIIGKALHRKATVYNSLAASAFLMLLYNPYFLWDVGFQLSYLAIIGIVWLQKPIQRLIFLKNNISRKIWEMTSITIAAQIITFPICIYYFHQFPNYFLIANLICVPLSTIILFAEILLMIISPFKFLANTVGACCFVLIKQMNQFVLFVNELPFSTIKNIGVGIFSTILLYIFIVVCINAIINKNKKRILFSLFISTFLIVFNLYGKIKDQQQQKIIIYNTPHKMAIDFIFSNNYVFVGDKNINENKTLQQSRQYFHAYHPIFLKNDCINQTIIFNNKKIMMIDSTFRLEQLTQSKTVDMLVICNFKNKELKEMLRLIHAQLIIFDAANSLWKIAKWKKECSALHLHYFSIPDDGAITYDLKNNTISTSKNLKQK